MSSLKKYNTKRKFDKTTEPAGKIEKKDLSKKPIFVIQKHWASRLHYDFRLENEGVLKSWAVPKGVPNVGEKKLAILVEDHPFEYKDFEGNIPRGNYGAGTVMIWDNGFYELSENMSLTKKLRKGEFSFKLFGKKINGEFALVKLKKSDKNEWLFICKSRDKSEGIDENISVKSLLTKEEIKSEKYFTGKTKGAFRKKMPTALKPMLASLAEKPFNDKKWIFEIKWDGYRIIAQKNNSEVNLFTRNGKNYNKIFSKITEELKKIKGNFIIDGEVVAVDEKGNSSFQLLQNYLNDKKGTLIYYVFDILYLNGFDIRNVSLIERKKIIKDLLLNFSLKNIKESEYITEKGGELFNVVASHQGEGIVAKKIDSFYKINTRSKDWLKIKTFLTQDVIICGYTLPRKSRKKFGALVTGVWESGKIKYSGHVGGGFDEDKLEYLMGIMEPLKTNKSSFEIQPKTNMPVTWIKPRLVCEIKFSQWTSEGIMRQPIFLRMRDDKEIKDAARENIKIDGEIFFKEFSNKIENISDKKLIFSNLDKIYWPEENYTKSDLIEYYKKISKYILPFLKNRPQSLNRFPNGINNKNFFQKDVKNIPKWIKTVRIFSSSENKYINYLICNDQETLLYLANLGCIEINVWSSSIGGLYKPDYIVFDIDPQDLPFSQTIKVALEMKKILDEISMKSFCKTSGSRGLHIFVPIKPQYSYDQIREFAKLICMTVNQKLPSITSLARKPENRRNKIYLDYLQNREGQTMAAAYCLRPKKGATVSTPLDWKEIDLRLDPTKFNIQTIFSRLEKRGDVWRGFFEKPSFDLNKSLVKLEGLMGLMNKKRNK